MLLLADIFEEFRKVSQTNYGLDAAHYLSSPHLSWDAMLKMTGRELELISDPELFSTIDAGIRGGVSMISKRYARANNPLLGPTRYNPNKPTTYIIYLDANNLYGWAMSQPLPFADFRFVDAAEWSTIDWLAQTENQPVGYFIECDLEYPATLHDLHNDYPLACERLCISTEMLSENQIRLKRNYNMSRSNSYSKLIPSFLPKRKYLAHYLLLRYYLEHGLKLRTVHRVIAFRQERWLAQYIELNTNLRAAAKSDFEKDHFKLMNNSVYGKTCENQKKRTDIKLVVTEEKRKRLTEKPHCLGFRIFKEQLAAIEMRKINTRIDKPFYVGYSVLELSKLHMYRFHYDVIKQQYGANAELLMTDTDSLVYLIRTQNVYDDMFAARDLYDFANLPKTSRYYDATNNKVIGKMKDETAGDPILEFVGLRPKMYSFLTVKDAEQPVARIEEKHRAKGIAFAASKLLQHQDFLSQLENPAENTQVNRRIGTRLHQLYTFEVPKRGLCAFDDKRFLLEDGVNSLAFGHYKAAAQVEYEDAPEQEGPLADQQIFAEQPARPIAQDVLDNGEDPGEGFIAFHRASTLAQSSRPVEQVCFLSSTILIN